MEFRLGRIGPNTKSQIQPACACCGYDAEWIIALVGLDDPEKPEGTLRPHIEKFFCDRDMRDALLDAINFNTAVPDSL